jgi:hypothetical protein
MALPLRLADDETEALHRRAELKNGPYGRGLTGGTPITVRIRHTASRSSVAPNRRIRHGCPVVGR